MAITDESWVAYLTVARTLQPLVVVPTPTTAVKGRFIKFLVDRLCKFWGEHKATLIPFLTQAAIAALESLVASQPAFSNVNPPGPD